MTFFSILVIVLTGSVGSALPTLNEKLECAKAHLIEELSKSDYNLDIDSLEIKESYNPVNVFYIGTDILAWINSKGLQGSDVQYVTFEASKSNLAISGWMYVLSFINLDGEPKHDCTVGNQSGKSSIALGKIIIDGK
jgi:hypothetical protein